MVNNKTKNQARLTNQVLFLSKLEHKIKKNKSQTLYSKMVNDENTKITKTINKNIEE